MPTMVVAMTSTDDLYGPSSIPTVFSDAGIRQVRGVSTLEIMTLVEGTYDYHASVCQVGSTCEAELMAVERCIRQADRAGLKRFRVIGDNERAMLLLAGKNVARKSNVKELLARCSRASDGLSVMYEHVGRRWNLAGLELERQQDELSRLT
jgi:hypothetical protein